MTNSKVPGSAKPKGKPRGGSRKGSPNKITADFRETVRKLLEDNSRNVGTWLKTVAEGDLSNDVKPDPAKALDLLTKLAEFAAPKLSRTEHTGENGGPVRVIATSDDQNL